MTTPTRRPLSRDVVIDAAIDTVDEQGLPGLTMRQLGQQLGVEAMSIYHYVDGREDLLEAVVDRLVGEVVVPPRDPTGSADGWQGFLQAVAHGIRSLATAHPALFPLVATRPPQAPWLRPPLRSLDLVENFLGGLGRRGLTDPQSVHVYKVFTTFLLGHLLLEAAADGIAEGLDEPLDLGSDEEGSELPDDKFPTLVRLSTLLRRHEPTADFEAALETLLDRLEVQLKH